MIVWLASYPKSGNTLLRSMIASYFFSDDGIFDFNIIRSVKQFPHAGIFQNFGINLKNEKEVIKNYIKVQETFSQSKSIQFLKTHSYLFNIENNPFTDLKNSLGAIYIVRDPRNIVTSASNFYTLTIDRSAERMFRDAELGGNYDSKNLSDRIKVYLGSWSSNYNSWKSFKYQNKYLLIKYEELVNNKSEIFKKILRFISELDNTELIINEKKFNNVIKTTDFLHMKKLEEREGFEEAKINKETGQKISFFHSGIKNDWKENLKPEIRYKIEKVFRKEMLELNYL